MFRYVALVWNEVDRTSCESAQRLAKRLQATAGQWQTALTQKGLLVFHAGAPSGSNEIYTVAEGRGVVLGKLFARSSEGVSYPAPLELTGNESRLITATRGRHLVHHYWGRYVAFVRDESEEITWVLQDPTAVLPCLSLRLGSVQIYFSWMDDVAGLVPTGFTVDWNYIGAALACQRLQLNRTGLAQITQLLGGEYVELSRDGVTKSSYWNPLEIANTDVIEDPAQAAQEMRRCARDCTHAWATCYDSILHTLSGGLDSSIVMACLQDAPSRPRMTCVNYHSAGSDGDERHFARLAARRAGQILIERERNPALSFERLLQSRRTSVPGTTFLYYLENHASEAQLAAECGAAAIFSGNAGDQLFYQARAVFAAGDFIRRRGFQSGTFGVALDAARMDRLSVWRVLKDGIAQGKFGRGWDMLSEIAGLSTLLTRECIEAAQRDESFMHPAFKSQRPYATGKLFHAYSMLFPPDLYNPMGEPSDPELVSPIYSQPLIELALRIPTYVLVTGGWDRSIARRAFAYDMPREIVTRLTKGGVEEHARAIFLRNLPLVRDLLLDGQLVRERILDRKAVERILSGAPTRAGASNVELYDCFSAEAWSRRWCSAPSLQRVA